MSYSREHLEEIEQDLKQEDMIEITTVTFQDSFMELLPLIVPTVIMLGLFLNLVAFIL